MTAVHSTMRIVNTQIPSSSGFTTYQIALQGVMSRAKTSIQTQSFMPLGVERSELDMFVDDDDGFELDDSFNFILDMASNDTVFTLLYFLFGWVLIAPPTEFISAGLTIPGLLGNYLGSEELHFIAYHIRRTTATAIFHSFLPLGYFIGLVLTSDDDHWLSILWRSSVVWNSLLLISCVLPMSVLGLAYYWSLNKWANHPIARTLAKYATEGSSWHAVASSICIEFRRVHKFTSGAPGRRLIVTDSWIILTGPYNLRLANQSIACGGRFIRKPILAGLLAGLGRNTSVMMTDCMDLIIYLLGLMTLMCRLFV